MLSQILASRAAIDADSPPQGIDARAEPPELARPAAPGKSRRRRPTPFCRQRALSQGHAVPDARAAPKTMMRLLATATAATMALLFSPTPGVLVDSGRAPLTGAADDLLRRAPRESPSRTSACGGKIPSSASGPSSSRAAAPPLPPGAAAVEEQSPARPGQAHDATPTAHRADARGVPRHAGARRGPPAPGGARGAQTSSLARRGAKWTASLVALAPHARARRDLRARRPRRARRGTARHRT